MTSNEFDLALPGGRIVPAEALLVRADTAGGPGGQHANRTASRVEVRVQIALLPLSDAERHRVEQRLAHRIAADGTVGARCGEHRSQHRNRQIATHRLEQLIREALHVDKVRRPTRPSRAALERIREAKRRRSERKKNRRQPRGGWSASE